MSATGTPTPNIGLRIPLGTDPASVDDINYNSNLIDTKLGAVGNDSVQDQIDALNSKLTNVDHAKIVFVAASVTIPSIAANAYASANVDVDIPTDTYGIKTIVPRYTNIGVPVAGAYGTTGAPTGKQRITVGIYNVTGAAQTNVTATVDVGFMY